jgi:hypothetical protein
MSKENLLDLTLNDSAAFFKLLQILSAEVRAARHALSILARCG